MTELLYISDAYLSACNAVVTEVSLELQAVTLDQTPFYPGGGGQPCDVGMLTSAALELPVNKVWRESGRVWHQVDGTLPEIGSPVQAHIDWQRRYALMRTHTALHILCGVVWRDYQALVTGGNMEPGQGRLDFEFETLHQDLVAEIERRVNEEISAARDIRTQVLPREEAFRIPDLIRTRINLLPEGIANVRTVEIVGLDLQADGGTHVANTREVGAVRVPGYQSKGRINKRIRLELLT